MTLEQRFTLYHKDNPHVYALLVAFARQVQGYGKHKYSIAALFERIRWHYDTGIQTAEPFKISNDFKPEYSRLIMHNEPDLVGFFNTKHLFASSRSETRGNA